MVKSKFAIFSVALAFFCATFHVRAQSNLALRVMAANITSGTGQSYESPGIRIFQGLKPDIVAIQEFRYNSSSGSNSLRTLVDTAFGPEFNFYVEPSGNIPNGIVSRYPILAAGSWDDTFVGDRGFAWALVDLPGTNELYVISVHLYGSGSASDRGDEATAIKAHAQTYFTPSTWVVVGGDMNTSSRGEAAIDTFVTFLSDSPAPTDLVSAGDPDTNEPRNKPYDYVLPSFNLASYQTPVVLGAQTFSKGLVFDSQTYNNNYTLSAVAPVQSGDSHVNGMQHMAVVKDFLIPIGTATTNAPDITAQPKSQTNAIGGNVSFNVVATGTAPLAYQWRFFGTNISSTTASSFALTNLQPTNAGDYSVVITNVAGSVTSSVATLTITTSPVITSQPQNISVNAGDDAAFTVGVSGLAPLNYQWRYFSTNIPDATNNSYARANAQMSDAGNYSVIVTNSSGSVTSDVAVLTVNTQVTGTLTALAGWNFSEQTNFGTSPLSATTNAVNLTVSGLTRGSGIATGGTAAGRAWGGSGFDSANATAAISANDFITFSMTANPGYELALTAVSQFDYRRSGTGPANGVLQYRLGTGAFIDITNLAYSSSSSSGASLSPIDLSGVSALQNVAANTTVTFRIVNYSGASGGTWYLYDLANTTAPDFAVSGIINAIVPNPPAQTAELSDATLAGNQFQFLLSGTAGSNYVVQASTNLSASNWISLRTNVAPFIFVESNTLALPQRFYRGIVAP